MNEIVKYHNDLNDLIFPDFVEQEYNVFNQIIKRMIDKGDEVVEFSAEEVSKFFGGAYSKETLAWMLSEMAEEMAKKGFKHISQKDNCTQKAYITMFPTFFINTIPNPNPNFKNDKYLKETLISLRVRINPDFTYLFNNIIGNFTNYELAEFISLSGKYTKRLYMLLKQFRDTGICTKYRNRWEDFCLLLGIDRKSYPNQNDIDKILKQAIRELTEERNLFDTTRIPFENLTYTKVKGKGRGRGGNVIGIEFSFKKQTELLTKDEQIKALREENAELTKEVFENNIAKAENEELKQKIEKLEKIAYGIGLKAYCGLKYYSDKNETLKVLDFNEVKNPSNSERYVAEILNEKTNKSFFLYVESPKHLINIISKNEKDLYFHNQEIINTRAKNIIDA